MICYKDKTYCLQSLKPRQCRNTKCWRYLTRSEGKRAAGMGLGIAVGDFRPTCGSFIPITTETPT